MYQCACEAVLSRGCLVIELLGFAVLHSHIVLCSLKYVAVICLHYYTVLCAGNTSLWYVHNNHKVGVNSNTGADKLLDTSLVCVHICTQNHNQIALCV